MAYVRARCILRNISTYLENSFSSVENPVFPTIVVDPGSLSFISYHFLCFANKLFQYMKSNSDNRF